MAPKTLDISLKSDTVFFLYFYGTKISTSALSVCI